MDRRPGVGEESGTPHRVLVVGPISVVVGPVGMLVEGLAVGAGPLVVGLVVVGLVVVVGTVVVVVVVVGSASAEGSGASGSRRAFSTGIGSAQLCRA